MNKENEHEDGQLRLTPAVILTRPSADYGAHQTVGHELAPMLFLDRMRRSEQNRQRELGNFRADVGLAMFTREFTDHHFDPSVLIADLFTEERAPLPTAGMPIAATTPPPLPLWFGTVFGIIITVIISYFAGNLGRTVARLLFEKKGAEDHG